MNALLDFWKSHGTKALGAAQIIVSAAVATPGLLHDPWITRVSFVNGILGAWTLKRGFFNSQQTGSPP